MAKLIEILQALEKAGDAKEKAKVHAVIEGLEKSMTPEQNKIFAAAFKDAKMEEEGDSDTAAEYDSANNVNKPAAPAAGEAAKPEGPAADDKKEVVDEGAAAKVVKVPEAAAEDSAPVATAEDPAPVAAPVAEAKDEVESRGGEGQLPKVEAVPQPPQLSPEQPPPAFKNE